MTEKKNVLLAAGSNAAGQLGLGHLDDSHSWQRCMLENNQSFPVMGSRICHLSSGSAHSVAILQDENNNNERQIWGCGSGADGQLGTAHWNLDDKKEDDKKLLLNFTRLNIEDLLANSQHSSSSSSSKWSPKLVECGWDWTLLVLEDSKGKHDDLLLVLGINNDFLQLGYTRNKDAKTCSQSIDLRSLCVPKEQSEMPRIQIEAIACGLRHSIVVCSAKSQPNSNQYYHWLVGWGASRHGQVGKVQSLQSNNTTSTSRGKVALACLPRVIQRWQSEGGGYEKEFVRLAAGKEHSVILIPSLWQIESTLPCSSTSGFDQKCHSNPFSFGSNRNSQCALNALPSNDEKVQRDGTGFIGATWNGTFLITSDRSNNSINIVSCGNNAKGQSGTGNAKPMHETELGVIHNLSIDNAAAADHARCTQQIVQLACGSEHVALLLESKSNIHTSPPQARVIGWGWNEHGNLAQNDEKDRHIPVQLWPIESDNLTDQLNFPNAKPIDCWAGCGTTFLQIQL